MRHFQMLSVKAVDFYWRDGNDECCLMSDDVTESGHR